MLFAASWMDLEIIILSEVNQTERQIPCDNITCTWDLRSVTNELIYETETGSQMQRTDCHYQGGEVAGKGSTESLGLTDINYYL